MNKRRFVTSAIWPDEHRKILLEMHEKGATILDIAVKLNRTKNSIIGYIHRAGLSNSRPKKPAQRVPRKPQVIETKPVKQLFVQPIVEVKPPQQTTGVLFVYTNNRQCKWVEGEPVGENTRVCGKRTMFGKSWCPEHFTLVYNKQPVFDMRGQLHG
jgi:hypothetical protein